MRRKRRGEQGIRGLQTTDIVARSADSKCDARHCRLWSAANLSDFELRLADDSPVILSPNKATPSTSRPLVSALSLPAAHLRMRSRLHARPLRQLAFCAYTHPAGLGQGFCFDVGQGTRHHILVNCPTYFPKRLEKSIAENFGVQVFSYQQPSRVKGSPMRQLNQLFRLILGGRHSQKRGEFG